MNLFNQRIRAEEWLLLNAGNPDHIELGLERCQKVLGELNPRKPPYEIITVAGTNGKGSTVAFMDSILSASGLLTGRYSSPHLQSFNERIQVAQIPIKDSVIVDAFEKVKKAATDIPLSYFEYATLAGLLVFAEAQVDIALLEVGLGGRLDAVNSVDADVAVITSIALDHQDWLGNDLEQIGREKAGIMRSGKPVILGSKTLPESVVQHANSIGCEITQLGRNYEIEVVANGSGENAPWSWRSEDTQMLLPQPGLIGDIQIQNAANAIAAITQTSFWPLKPADVAEGIKSVKLFGRLQNKVVQERKWYLDVAHNPAAVEKLVEYFTKNRSVKSERMPVVFSMLKDKDIPTCIELLKPLVSDWYICALDSPRAVSVNEMCQVLQNSGVTVGNIFLADTVQQSCEAALKSSRLDDAILVCGSFLTVGNALDYLHSD